MRYREIIETNTATGERVAKANHRKAQAARTYQERMRKAGTSRSNTFDREANARTSYQNTLQQANDSIRSALNSD